MIKVAIIGAGEISKRHLKAYKSISNVSVDVICDMNEMIAKERAAEFGIQRYCTDYKEILADESVDAVDIVTPTFTHNNLVVSALEHGKNVLCEKPPALTYEEALENEDAAKKSGKLLMYGFVSRFNKYNTFLKKYIDAGNLGNIYYAEASRMAKCDTIGGWFRSKEKAGGGALMDAAIHQLDALMYFMGYPKVNSVRGFTTDVNKTLPDKMNGLGSIYTSVSDVKDERTIESFANAYVNFEGGKTLFIKAGHIVNTVNEGTRYEILGDKGGASFSGGVINLVSVDKSNYFLESQPVLNDVTEGFTKEIQHFVDCCNGDAQCICTAHQGSEIMKVISAIYESAKTGKEILFE